MENVNKYHAVLVKISLYGPHLKKKKKKLLKKLPKASKNPIITVKSCQKKLLLNSHRYGHLNTTHERYTTFWA